MNMNCLNYSSPDTATSESCTSSANSSVTNTNFNSEIINSLNNIDIHDFENNIDNIITYNPNTNSKRPIIDFNLLNDERVLKNLLKLEDSYTIQCDYFKILQQEVKPWMRNVLANWMLEVCENQKCEEGVFVLAMNILDRFLSIQAISKRYLQLLGTVCMFIASKIRSSICLNAETLIIYTDRSINIEELLEWEQFVLQKLHWDVNSITPNDFIPQLLPHLSFLDSYTLKMIRQHLNELISLCSTDFRFSILTSSMITSASILNIINLLIDDDITINRVIQVLNEFTAIEIDCLNECQEQIEELIHSSFQIRPELAEIISTSKYQSRRRNISNQILISNHSKIAVY